MKILSKERLIKLFKSTKQANPESSLDELLYEAFNHVRENEQILLTNLEV
jgi:hypothetical protein